jgi:hypothetical protein
MTFTAPPDLVRKAGTDLMTYAQEQIRLAKELEGHQAAIAPAFSTPVKGQRAQRELLESAQACNQLGTTTDAFGQKFVTFGTRTDAADNE